MRKGSRTMKKENTTMNKESATMNQTTDMVDSWTKSQMELLNSWVKAQKDGVAYWAEATAKMQESLQGFSVPQEGPAKEVRNFYTSVMTVVANSTKAIALDSGKMQETWKSAVEKQLELAGTMMKQCAGVFQTAATQK